MYKIRNGREVHPVDNQIRNDNDLTPRPNFSMYIVAPKGGGKSTLLISLLLSKQLCGGVFHRILFYSPTNSLDEKIRKLENVKGLTAINYPLIKQLKKLNKKKSIFATDTFEEEHSTSNIEFHESVNMDDLDDLKKYNESIIKTFGKEYCDKTLLIFDDMSANKKLWNSEKFKKLIFNSRHYNFSVIITSQTYHSIAKDIRLNNTIFVLFQITNINELKQIFEENSSGMDFKDFNNLLKEIFKTKYNFLTINYSNDPEHRLQERFTRYLTV